jgi:transcriptional regulator with XRE-family HTH domain
MGRAARRIPERLPEKLLLIRKDLGFSQQEMAERLSEYTKVTKSQVSKYEQGKQEPQLHMLLKYARLGGVSTDILIDDSSILPADRFPDYNRPTLFDDVFKIKKGSK